jgi:peptidoglycan hydrolase-like protein with peptidoglycan-binding domain
VKLRHAHRTARQPAPAERGSITVIVALALTALLVLAALVTDVGWLYVMHERSSMVADAAALSGAQFLPHDVDRAVQTVQTYLDKNGFRGEDVTIAVNRADQTLSVMLQERVELTFARVLGRDSELVRSGAVARTAPLTGYNAVVPLGVVQADWKLGDPVMLKAGPADGTLSPGNYGALSLGGKGASNYESNLQSGYTGWVRAGDWLLTETGNMAGPTERALLARIARDPSASYATVTKGSPRIIVIPVLSSFQANGRGEVQVAGFGAFFLDGVDTQGNDQGTVYGRFLRYHVTGESLGSGPDFAVYTIKLTH